MEATIYVDTTNKTAHNSTGGSGPPNVPCTAFSHLLLQVYFFASSAAPALLDVSTTFRVALKDKYNPDGSVLALLSAPTTTGANYYKFEWSQIDSAALRTLLGEAQSVAAMLEIEWTLAGKVERVSIPVSIANAWLGPSDAGPDFQPFKASITSLGYLRLVSDNGTVYFIGLNTGEPPSS